MTATTGITFFAIFLGKKSSKKYFSSPTFYGLQTLDNHHDLIQKQQNLQ